MTSSVFSILRQNEPNKMHKRKILMAVCYLFRLTNTVSKLLNIWNGSNNLWDLFGFLHKKKSFWCFPFLSSDVCDQEGSLFLKDCLEPTDFSVYIFYIVSGITQICHLPMKLSAVIASCFWDCLHCWCQKEYSYYTRITFVFFSFILCSQVSALKIYLAMPRLHWDSAKSCWLKWK